MYSYILEIASEYQETACRSANALGIPVLDIDKGITEIIAFNKSTCAIQLRQIIDDVYQKYIEAFGKWKYESDRENCVRINRIILKLKKTLSSFVRSSVDVVDK